MARQQAIFPARSIAGPRLCLDRVKGVDPALIFPANALLTALAFGV
jgi:hypothetical protein